MKNKKRLIYLLIVLWAVGAQAQEGSVLGSGTWWKLAVAEEGLYRITTTEVPGLQGTQVAKLAVYGRGGNMISFNNSATPVDDMPQLAIDVIDHDGDGIFEDGDELLFFGEGVELWKYNNSTAIWEFSRHAYANNNCYFLTCDAEEGRRIAKVDTFSTTSEIVTYTAVANVDNDLVNVYGSGQRWMGEKFTSAMSQRTFHIDIPASTSGRLNLRYGLVNKDYSTGHYTISTSGYNATVDINSTTVYTTGSGSINSNASSFDITVSFSPGGSNATGYLDFLELNSKAGLKFSGGQLVIRNNLKPTDKARFTLVGATAATRVWEVTSAGSEREMTLANGYWTDHTKKEMRYIIFDGTSYLTPASVSPLANQNLHDCEAADLVIVCNEAFLEQSQRLATLHEVMDGLHTLVVTDEKVYNEYSSGKQDPLAIRSLLRDMAARYPDKAPRYLLLFGKGTYDNRNLTGHNLPTVVAYETPFSFDEEGASYCSDDILGYIDPECKGSSLETPDVSVGRLPARSAEEADLMLDKIEGYIMLRDLQTDGERGDWRNWVALLSDDADPGHPFDSTFAHSNEVVARNITANHPHLNIDKLYADSYHQSTGAIGSYYPDLNNALQQRMNNGCLLLNYIGHGSATYIGTERYMELSDLGAYNNTDKLPLFVTSTCSYGRYDMTDALCGAETGVLSPAAMVAVISASRPITHSEKFNNDVVQFALDPHNSIGDALRLAKKRTTVSPCISLLGDPALRLSQPEHRVVVTHINHRPVSEGVDDSATVLSRVTVTGEIQDTNGTLLTDFDGTLYPIVFDRMMQTSTLANDNPGTEVRFTQQKNVLYRGSHSVKGGKFEYSFVVPQDVAYQYAYAKLSHYARSVGDHASGCYTQLLLGGMNDTADIATSAPDIRLYIGDTNFRSGGITDAQPTLVALLRDSAGINAGAGLGHDITAVLDGNPGSLVVLNDLFEPDVENVGCGSVSYRFTDLTPGYHTLTLKAWNIYNISSEATIGFTVHHPDTLAISNLSCSPNPASGQTSFMLEVNNTSHVVSAELQIYNSHGQLIQSAVPAISADGYVVGPVIWNVGSVPPGLYLARMLVTDTEGKVHQQATKCIVR